MSNSINHTYIYYNVVDYTGSNVLSSFTLGNTPLTFKPDFSTSPLSGATTISNKALRWDFGDGTFSTDLVPTHTYTWPGEYRVTLTVFDAAGNAYDSTFSTIIRIYDFIPTQIAFNDYKSLVYDIPAGQLIDPLTVTTNFSWQDYSALSATGYTINLYASGAKGDYNYVADTLKDKWEHLRSLSRFYTLSTINGNQEFLFIDSIQPTITPIYVAIINNKLQQCSPTTQGSVLAGVTGNCQFWYTDDRPASYLTDNSPIIVFASLDNSKFNDAFTQKTRAYDFINYPPYGFQNIDPAVFPNIKTRYNPASYLSITTTGIDGEGTLSSTSFNIPYISWQETDIPYIIKFKDSSNFTTKNYPPLSSSATVNGIKIPQPYYDVQTGIVYNTSNGTAVLTGVTFYEDFVSQAPQSLGAFYKGYFISSQSCMNCTLTAAVTVKEPAYYHKDSLVSWIAIPQYNAALRLLRQQNIDGFTETSSITYLDALSSELSTGNNINIYAITVAPSGSNPDNDYQAWVADNVNDTIVKYDVYGNSTPLYTDTNGIVHYVYTLSSMPTLINNVVVYVDYRSTAMNNISAHAAPNNITIDSNSDIWVTLIDSGSAIKIDNTKGYITTVAAPLSTFNTLYYTESASYNSNEGFVGEGLILPSSIETDFNNNVWIAYNHPNFNYLIQYQGTNNFTTAANQLTAIQLPSGMTPEEIRIDRNRFLWVTANNHNAQQTDFGTFNDYLYKFDANGNIVNGFPLSGFQQIGNITIDGDQNAWVVQGAETITKIDGLSGTLTNYIAGKGNNKTTYICSIGGITCDTSNQIWVINNFDNNIYIFDPSTISKTTLTPVKTLPLIYPNGTAPNLSSDPYVTPIAHGQYSDGLQQFQAYGDWNGYNWINKYAAPISVVRTITGSSNLFNIYSGTGEYNIAKQNENWNASGFYNSLRYQENLLQQQVFFDQFLGVIVGKNNAQPYELGKTIYEKIANFVNNNADVDKANVNELLSFCTELSVNYEKQTDELPPQLQRLVDLLSIKQSILWGEQNKYALNFNSTGNTFTNNQYGINLGTQIDPITGVITSGVPIVAYETFSGTYKLVNTTYFDLTGDTITTLSAYTPDWGWGLVVPDNITGTKISPFYTFYNYNPVFNNTYYNNIINWNDANTTLSPQNSSYQQWNTDDGIMQNIISYEFSKGLRLFTSAVDITYNS